MRQRLENQYVTEINNAGQELRPQMEREELNSP